MTAKQKRHAAYRARLQARLERQPVDSEYARLREFAPFAGSVPGAWLDPLVAGDALLAADIGLTITRTQP